MGAFAQLTLSARDRGAEAGTHRAALPPRASLTAACLAWLVVCVRRRCVAAGSGAVDAPTAPVQPAHRDTVTPWVPRTAPRERVTLDSHSWDGGSIPPTREKQLTRFRAVSSPKAGPVWLVQVESGRRSYAVSAQLIDVAKAVDHVCFWHVGDRGLLVAARRQRAGSQRFPTSSDVRSGSSRHSCAGFWCTCRGCCGCHGHGGPLEYVARVGGGRDRRCRCSAGDRRRAGCERRTSCRRPDHRLGARPDTDRHGRACSARQHAGSLAYGTRSEHWSVSFPIT